MQVNAEIGLTFASGLRALLRQSPDVVMIGEIRDFETADIAMKSSLTGQLVLSTLHTNDASSAVTRLIDMGVEPFLVATSVNLVEAQRLVRTLCTKCRQPFTPPPDVVKDLGKDLLKGGSFYKPKGCRLCRKTGYRPELAWSLHEYADMLLERDGEGDKAKATSLLDESLQISSDLGMRPLMERVLSRREILKA